MARSLIDITQDLTGRMGLTAPKAVLRGKGDLLPQYVRSLYATAHHLLARYSWQVMERECVFTTVAGDTQINFSSVIPDFRYIKDETVWNRTQQIQMLAVSDKVWAAGKVLTPATTRPHYRIRGNTFLILNNETAGDTVSFEYVSRNWVTSADGATSKAAPTRDDDLLLLDDELLILGAIWRFQHANGLEYGESFAEYERCLHMLTGHDKPRETLSVSPGEREPALGVNVPLTGWGL